MTVRVFIKNLELLARIGVHGHEQGMPQPVRITVELDAEQQGERLDDVVDYEVVANGIRAIVASGHINLAETLADRIADMCLADARVMRAIVKVEKLHALPGAEAAGVQVERVR